MYGFLYIALTFLLIAGLIGVLVLSDNLLTGTIPTEIGLASNMGEWIYMAM
jgi:hypothetical protein